jgi:hypothetical protein
MEQNEIANIIARATRKDMFLTEEERRIKGARTFKRKVLGLCGSQSIKTLNEMAQTLYSTGIASSVEEGREITPLLMGGRVSFGLSKEIAFDEVIDGKGNKKYRIWAYSYSYDD